jgi:hypothetical protein
MLKKAKVEYKEALKLIGEEDSRHGLKSFMCLLSLHFDPKNGHVYFKPTFNDCNVRSLYRLAKINDRVELTKEYFIASIKAVLDKIWDEEEKEFKKSIN